ncbi:MAG: ArsC family transcriptional regulator [Clostridia bacterium]|nr:ArsC family transcriptional regulator [Clostridia bacterium]MBR2287745.1 ArsC family transcriptional regulator [Clostridia bacterium]
MAVNIQLYYGKKNFDVQKAQRFFKERRITVQELDLKKHRLGEREVQTMARALGMQNLLDREDKKVKEHPACYYNKDEDILQAILENPWLLKCPIVRSGNRVTAGYAPQIWETWLEG